MTGIIEQIHSEVSERAASPEGLLRLIHMVMTEVSNLDVKSPQFNSHYVSLVQTYVLAKRQYIIMKKRTGDCNRHTFNYMEYVFRTKREEAKEYAAQHLSLKEYKELNRIAGRNNPLIVPTPQEVSDEYYNVSGYYRGWHGGS